MKITALLIIAAPILFGQPNPVNFHGQCEVSFQYGRPFVVGCTVASIENQDNYTNAKRVITLDSSPIDLTLPRTADYITSAAIDGGWVVQSQFVIRIVAVPSDRDVQAWFSNEDWAHNTQPENITITKLPGDGWEVLIDGDFEDFNGDCPSQEWLHRYMITFQRLSGELTLDKIRWPQ